MNTHPFIEHLVGHDYPFWIASGARSVHDAGYVFFFQFVTQFFHLCFFGRFLADSQKVCVVHGFFRNRKFHCLIEYYQFFQGFGSFDYFGGYIVLSLFAYKHVFYFGIIHNEFDLLNR